MDVYHFSEMAYHPAWEEGRRHGSFRVDFPNGVIDPKIASNLLNRYLDEFMLADELGLNIMRNEHQSTATCMTASCTVPLSILARQTRKARLLALGNPIAHRPDPVRVAEEMAMIDVISGGRLELGLVKAAPFEIHPANSSPYGITDRFWEAHDLVLKALSTRDGAFSWESEHYHYRNVNIWPRPYQDPHPPVWITALSPGSGREIAERGHIACTLVSGMAAKGLFETYRKRAAEVGKSAHEDRLAYAVLVGVGETEEEGRRFADQICDYVRTTGIIREPYQAPPGFIPVAGKVASLRAPPEIRLGGSLGWKTMKGKAIDPFNASLDDFMEMRSAFAGTPDQVYEQIVDFYHEVGGFGHLIIFGQGGPISHEDTKKNLTLFAREVAPRLKDLKLNEERVAAAQ